MNLNKTVRFLMISMNEMKGRIFFLVVLMVVLPLLAESIYAPGLPGLALGFSVSDAAAETTLSIYLLGMSMGVLFWGNLSEVLGRKSVVLFGFLGRFRFRAFSYL